jgi:lincosamide nucleotidyltransferase A/C/D/E
MVSAQDAIRIYQLLVAHGIRVWVCGGWGIDALLGEQTRPHKDLDVILLLDDAVSMRELLSKHGFSLAYLWPENRWAKDAQGIKTATAFVLQDSQAGEIDAHALVLDEQGNGIPAWEGAGELVFTRLDFAYQGSIAGQAIQCLSPETQILCHLGYELPEQQRADMELLESKFKIAYPW